MCKTTLMCLLEQALNGETSEEAFRNEFCKFYYESVFTIARNFTNSNQDAEDVTNDVFLKKIIKLSLAKFQNIFAGNVEGWILVVVRNYCFTYYKSNKKRRNQDELDETIVQGCKPTIDAKMELDDTLENMPSIVKEIFTLKSEGYKTKEIAQQLNLTEGKVKMIIFRWRKRR